MRRLCELCLVLGFLATDPSTLLAQHCPPIIESYLESISLKERSGELSLRLDYRKSGGQSKASYQAYLLAYVASDKEQIEAMTPQAAIESKLVTILDTQRISRLRSGCYRFRWKMKSQEFVATLLKESRLDDGKKNNAGGYQSFKDKIRLAVFIPFLEDEKYSTIEGLPSEKHECNYAGNAALLYDTLPQVMSVHFGVVQGYALPGGTYDIQINHPSQKLPKDKAVP